MDEVISSATEGQDTEIEDNLEKGPEEAIPFKYSITSYGADYPVDTLIKRIEDGAIYVPPFQRGYVWSLKTASRFVESLLLGLPVPGIFLSREEPTQKLLVIDGQQRLLTLKYFYDGIFAKSGREFALDDVESRFGGATYRSLDQEDRRRLDDSIIHATIVRQDEPSDEQSSIYHIFERLNTGGDHLVAQEIRAALYHGPFNDVLRALNAIPQWRDVYGRPSKRMRDQELILRFLALYFQADDYSPSMKGFLNAFMAKHRDLKELGERELSAAFSGAINAIDEAIGRTAFRPRRALNAAVFDAVMAGVARRLEQGQVSDSKGLAARYRELLQNESFLSATETGTSHQDNVETRLDLATKAFADVA